MAQWPKRTKRTKRTTRTCRMTAAVSLSNRWIMRIRISNQTNMMTWTTGTLTALQGWIAALMSMHWVERSWWGQRRRETAWSTWTYRSWIECRKTTTMKLMRAVRPRAMTRRIRKTRLARQVWSTRTTTNNCRMTRISTSNSIRNNSCSPKLCKVGRNLPRKRPMISNKCQVKWEATRVCKTILSLTLATSQWQVFSTTLTVWTLWIWTKPCSSSSNLCPRW